MTRTPALKQKLTKFLSLSSSQVPTKSSTKPTTIAQAYTYKDVTGTTSTSTTPLPDASTSTSSKGKPSPKKQAVVKKVAVSFEQGCKEWFEEFQDPDEVGRVRFFFEVFATVLLVLSRNILLTLFLGLDERRRSRKALFRNGRLNGWC